MIGSYPSLSGRFPTLFSVPLPKTACRGPRMVFPAEGPREGIPPLSPRARHVRQDLPGTQKGASGERRGVARLEGDPHHDHGQGHAIHSCHGAWRAARIPCCPPHFFHSTLSISRSQMGCSILSLAQPSSRRPRRRASSSPPESSEASLRVPKTSTRPKKRSRRRTTSRGRPSRVSRPRRTATLRRGVRTCILLNACP